MPEVNYIVCKETCLDFFKDLNTRDIKVLQKWFDDHSTLCIPPKPVVTGASRILALFRAIFNRYTQLEWNVSEIFQITENRFIVASVSKGTFKNQLPYQNKLLTDISFSNDLSIIHLSDYFKNTAIFL